MTDSPLQNLLEVTKDSPLTEADPKSLDELMRRAETVFNKRPILGLTDEDIDDAVSYYRAKRSHFAQLAKERENAAPKKRRSPASSVAEALARSIDEIEL